MARTMTANMNRPMFTTNKPGTSTINNWHKTLTPEATQKLRAEIDRGRQWNVIRLLWDLETGGLSEALKYPWLPGKVQTRNFIVNPRAESVRLPGADRTLTLSAKYLSMAEFEAPTHTYVSADMALSMSCAGWYFAVANKVNPSVSRGLMWLATQLSTLYINGGSTSEEPGSAMGMYLTLDGLVALCMALGLNLNLPD